MVATSQASASLPPPPPSKCINFGSLWQIAATMENRMILLQVRMLISANSLTPILSVSHTVCSYVANVCVSRAWWYLGLCAKSLDQEFRYASIV